jgi:hypothetical protein
MYILPVILLLQVADQEAEALAAVVALAVCSPAHQP